MGEPGISNSMASPLYGWRFTDAFRMLIDAMQRIDLLNMYICWILYPLSNNYGNVSKYILYIIAI